MATINFSNQRKTNFNVVEDEDNVYYNCLVSIPSSSTSFSEARFNVTRTEPILNNPSEYEVGIIRFNVPSAIPIFIFPPVANPPAVPDSELKVRMTYSNTTITTTLIYQDFTSGFNLPLRSIWHYQQLLEILNTALSTCYDDMKSAQPGVPPTVPPFVTFDAQTQLFTLNAPKLYNEVDAGAETIKIWFNEQLYNGYFPSFVQNEVADRFGRMAVLDTKTNSTTFGAVDYYKMEGEYSTLGLWSGIKSILFETDRVPVTPELLGTQNNQIRTVLTDFEPLVNINNRESFQYFPQGPIRYYNLQSQYPLNNIDLNVRWEDKNGDTYPIYITPGNFCSVKLHFRKKKSVRNDD